MKMWTRIPVRPVQIWIWNKMQICIRNLNGQKLLGVSTSDHDCTQRGYTGRPAVDNGRKGRGPAQRILKNGSNIKKIILLCICIINTYFTKYNFLTSPLWQSFNKWSHFSIRGHWIWAMSHRYIFHYKYQVQLILTNFLTSPNSAKKSFN